ncbi:endonuclease/exonuclease/phosphatase family protein [Hoeflea sp. YIM 152468]|uniref:endonuclease/exonuclease/phosphatase family protein n=1 Tax=Hoeflea sp. YIM 152468 TaxID=3031759 RepID=UPI0023DCCD2F|nr:endonuclease/exonuclease/phosphatase family protein [Hoeflea sp. YIM 152468]MDF1609363.1 endonuclease/exonuclease/phosphatase family protein [Hoeflea sp. YIM 152468]
MSVRIATFNAENLMSRFDFSGFRNELRQDRVSQLYEFTSEAQYRQAEIARAVSLTDDTRQLTALAIAEADADILCLQEVENLDTLHRFEYGYLFKMIGDGYRHKVLIEGNDSRGINLALMTRDKTLDGAPIDVLDVTSHAHLSYEAMGLYTPDLEGHAHPNDKVFKRDCLEVDVRIGTKRLTIYVVHFKSMGSSRNGIDGRTGTSPVRMAEARGVRKIITDRFGANGGGKRYVIAGDFNDYSEKLVITGDRRNGYQFVPEQAEGGAVRLLTAGGFAENVVARRPELDRWTLYHTRGPQERHLCQLDYLLASPALTRSNRDRLPDIVRAGQPWRTLFPEGQQVDRYPRTGWDRPKASDHCPVAMSFDMV